MTKDELIEELEEIIAVSGDELDDSGRDNSYAHGFEQATIEIAQFVIDKLRLLND